MLLAGASSEDGMSSKQIADRAADACNLFTQHLARLLGDTGIQTLHRRSIALAGERFSWLVLSPSATTESACSGLRALLEQQQPEAATEGFVAVLWMFVGLLKRLIGEGLVERLLHEVWPAVFAPAKETP